MRAAESHAALVGAERAAAARTIAAPVLSLRGVHKRYRLGAHEVHALAGVDLDLHPGELLALTGPSGSGKSTLLHIAGLIDRQDQGTLTLAGQELGRQSEREATLLRRGTLGFVFQGFNLVPVMTAAENVELPLFLAGVPQRERRERAAAMLAAVGLSEHAGHRPDALSGGQRQRVAIARALVKRPAVVIADEPTASLDSATAAQVLELMRQLAREQGRELGRAQGAAFLIATHDERLLPHCDRVVHLHDGRISAVTKGLLP